MPDEYKQIYSILNSVFRPEEVINEIDDEDPADDVQDAGDELDAEIDTPDDLGGDLDGTDLGDELGGDDIGMDGDLGDGGVSDFGGGDLDVDDEEMDDEEVPEEPEEEPEEIGPKPEEEGLSDQEKVNKLYSDTGDIAYDYGSGTEPNVRLSRFKFINAEIDPEMYMDDEEKMTGVPSVVIEDRLAPEQKEVYFQSNKSLREKYPKISEREKNILIYNSGVRFVTYDLDNNEQPIEDPAQLNQAYKRIDEYMTKRYGVHWQDKRDAVELLKNIKVNFSDTHKIQPNLISSDNFSPALGTEEISKIPFNSVSVETPDYISEFIRSNLENPEFSKSSIFNSMASTYQTGKGKSDSPYAIIKGQGVEEGEEAAPDLGSEEEPDFGEEPDVDEPDLEGGEDEGVDEVEI